jgi:hypothetical protein
MTHWQRSSTRCHKYTNCQFSTQHKELHSCSTFSYSEVNSPTIYSSSLSSDSPTIYSSLCPLTVPPTIYSRHMSSDSPTTYSSTVSSEIPNTYSSSVSSDSPTIWSSPVSSDSPNTQSSPASPDSPNIYRSLMTICKAHHCTTRHGRRSLR